MTEIQNNLFGIKWPTGVDMPLNKTQTLIFLVNKYLNFIFKNPIMFLHKSLADNNTLSKNNGVRLHALV